MTAIWNSLVSEPTKTIDKYLMEIVHELQTNLTSNQWRVRESCCGALQDLVRGRSLSGPALQVKKLLNTIHIFGFCSKF